MSQGRAYIVNICCKSLTGANVTDTPLHYNHSFKIVIPNFARNTRIKWVWQCSINYDRLNICLIRLLGENLIWATLDFLSQWAKENRRSAGFIRSISRICISILNTFNLIFIIFHRNDSWLVGQLRIGAQVQVQPIGTWYPWLISCQPTNYKKNLERYWNLISLISCQPTNQPTNQTTIKIQTAFNSQKEKLNILAKIVKIWKSCLPDQ